MLLRGLDARLRTAKPTVRTRATVWHTCFSSSRRSQMARASSCAHSKRLGVRLAAAAEVELTEDDLARMQAIRMEALRQGVHVRFVVPEFVAPLGSTLAVVGSIPELGSWNPHASGAVMSWQPGNSWTAEVAIPPGCDVSQVEYKLVVLNGRGGCKWEPCDNRALPCPSLVASCLDGDTESAVGPRHMDITLSWGVREVIDSVSAGPRLYDLASLARETEASADLLPGRRAAAVLLQAQQQLSEARRIHRMQLSELRSQLVSLQQQSQKEAQRMQSQMRQVESMMEALLARLEQERAASEATIAVLQERIERDEFPVKKRRKSAAEKAAAAAAAQAAAAGIHGEEAAQAGKARRGRRASAGAAAATAAIAMTAGEAALEDAADLQVPMFMFAHESQVMSMLGNYSGLTLERLHTLLTNCRSSPKYSAEPEDLAAFLHHLVQNGHVTVDGAGVFRFKSMKPARAGTPRASPHAATPSRARSSSPAPPQSLHTHNDGSQAVATRALTPRSHRRSASPAHHASHAMAHNSSLATNSHAATHNTSSNISSHNSSHSSYSTSAPHASSTQWIHQQQHHQQHQQQQQEQEEEDDRFRPPPAESVPGGPPPGSFVPGSPHMPAAAKLTGKSIMPSFDSTGAHPSLQEVGSLEEPVLEALRGQPPGGLTLTKLHTVLRSRVPGYDRSQTELAAILKNLVDQHKVVHSRQGYSLVAY